ncbi:MAG: type II toxin-antitoxin system RelE family toxin [Acidimicrobiia bacterium]
MRYRVRVSQRAQKQIRRLDREVARSIRTFLEERLGNLDHPRQIGSALRSEERLWRYRVGDYRVIVEIQDEQLVVLVVELGHRREIYRK